MQGGDETRAVSFGECHGFEQVDSSISEKE